MVCVFSINLSATGLKDDCGFCGGDNQDWGAVVSNAGVSSDGRSVLSP